MSLRLPPEQYALLVKQVLNRDGYKCRSCRSRNNLHAHHLQFRSQQGADTLDNLVVLCNQCHEALHRGDLTINNGVDIVFMRLNGWRPN